MTKQTSTGPQIETQPSEAIPQDTEVVVDDDRNSSSPSPEPETPRAQVEGVTGEAPPGREGPDGGQPEAPGTSTEGATVVDAPEAAKTHAEDGEAAGPGSLATADDPVSAERVPEAEKTNGDGGDERRSVPEDWSSALGLDPELDDAQPADPEAAELDDAGAADPGLDDAAPSATDPGSGALELRGEAEVEEVLVGSDPGSAAVAPAPEPEAETIEVGDGVAEVGEPAAEARPVGADRSTEFEPEAETIGPGAPEPESGGIRPEAEGEAGASDPDAAPFAAGIGEQLVWMEPEAAAIEPVDDPPGALADDLEPSVLAPGAGDVPGALADDLEPSTLAAAAGDVPGALADDLEPSGPAPAAGDLAAPVAADPAPPATTSPELAAPSEEAGERSVDADGDREIGTAESPLSAAASGVESPPGAAAPGGSARLDPSTVAELGRLAARLRRKARAASHSVDRPAGPEQGAQPDPSEPVEAGRVPPEVSDAVLEADGPPVTAEVSEGGSSLESGGPPAIVEPEPEVESFGEPTAEHPAIGTSGQELFPSPRRPTRKAPAADTRTRATDGAGRQQPKPAGESADVGPSAPPAPADAEPPTEPPTEVAPAVWDQPVIAAEQPAFLQRRPFRAETARQPGSNGRSETVSSEAPEAPAAEHAVPPDGPPAKAGGRRRRFGRQEAVPPDRPSEQGQAGVARPAAPAPPGRLPDTDSPADSPVDRLATGRGDPPPLAPVGERPLGKIAPPSAERAVDRPDREQPPGPAPSLDRAGSRGEQPVEHEPPPAGGEPVAEQSPKPAEVAPDGGPPGQRPLADAAPPVEEAVSSAPATGQRPLADAAAPVETAASVARERVEQRYGTAESPILELRQVAGLTAGTVMDLTEPSYAFAQHDEVVGFTISVDDQRAVVIPGAAEASIDTEPVVEPMLLGSGVLDVGTARFLVQRRREQKRATDWLDLEQRIDQPESVIDVPPELVALAEEEASRSRRRLFRRRGRSGRFDDAALDLASWNLLEAVRATRVEAAERERYLHPDPAELSVRAANRAPILGRREPGHPLFGAVGVICADMPWMPRFDDPEAIPEALRPEVQALMSLPSIPISADLRIGPLGIAGPRSAALACARHILVSLYALSSADLHLHVITSDAQADAWDWSVDLAPFRQIEPVGPYSVLIVDGMDNFASSGISHQDAIDNRVGLVVIAEEVTGLPPYSGTVLQVDRSGGGRLTNDKGHIITGTPVGVTTDFARRVAADLYEATAER